MSSSDLIQITGCLPREIVDANECFILLSGLKLYRMFQMFHRIEFICADCGCINYRMNCKDLKGFDFYLHLFCMSAFEFWNMIGVVRPYESS